MADKIRARWPLYATLTVALLIVVGVGFVMAGGPSKIGFLAAGDADHFDTVLTHEGFAERFWIAPYKRTLSPGVGWADGDRDGYRCMYGFLMRNGVPVGRFTFIRIPGAATYAAVKDNGMVEGSRFYDGTVAPADAPKELQDCPQTSESYELFTGDDRPTIRFRQGSSKVLETRDYKLTEVLPGVTFQQFSRTNKRIVVVAYFDELPIYGIYYDIMPGVQNVNLTSDIGG